MYKYIFYIYIFILSKVIWSLIEWQKRENHNVLEYSFCGHIIVYTGNIRYWLYITKSYSINNSAGKKWFIIDCKFSYFSNFTDVASDSIKVNKEM